MRLAKPTTCLSLILLCCLHWSCTQNTIDQKPQARVRIRKVTDDLRFLLTTDTYTYDDANRLVSVDKVLQENFTTPINHVPYFIRSYSRTLLLYDQQNRLIEMQIGSSERSFSSTYTYVYAGTGERPVLIHYTPTTSDPAFNNSRKKSYQLEYGDQESPIKVTQLSVDNAVEGGYEYTYLNGNVVTIKTFSSDTYVKPQVFQYQFDDKPSPFYKLYSGIPYPGVIGKQNLFYQDNPFNKNNRLTAGYAYAYDSTGHITKAGTTTFDYETY